MVVIMELNIHGHVTKLEPKARLTALQISYEDNGDKRFLSAVVLNSRKAAMLYEGCEIAARGVVTTQSYEYPAIQKNPDGTEEIVVCTGYKRPGLMIHNFSMLR